MTSGDPKQQKLAFTPIFGDRDSCDPDLDILCHFCFRTWADPEIIRWRDAWKLSFAERIYRGKTAWLCAICEEKYHPEHRRISIDDNRIELIFSDREGE